LTEQQQNTSRSRVIGIASLIWAASIFLSRVMGLIREQIIGRTLGASRQADLYFASFTLPDFLNYLLAAGALSIGSFRSFWRTCSAVTIGAPGFRLASLRTSSCWLAQSASRF
jgi:hypothetical protein